MQSWHSIPMLDLSMWLARQAMLAGLPNGEVKEEDLEGLVRWATL